MRYTVEFDSPSELVDNASEGIYKALVSVLGNIGNFRILRWRNVHWLCQS